MVDIGLELIITRVSHSEMAPVTKESKDVTKHEGPIVLVCGGDDNFAMPMAVMLYSVFANLTRQMSVDVYIMDNNISDANKANLARVTSQPSLPERQVKITYVPVNVNAFRSLSADKEHLNASAYMRLLMAELLPGHDKVIYLDGDIIVHGNLNQLWDLSTEDYDLLAVADFYTRCADYYSDSDSSAGIAPYEELGIPRDTPYFNSGVMVVNLERWRQTNLIDKAMNYINRYQNAIKFADQDVLNAVIRGNWGQLDLHWNVQIFAVRAFEYIPESPVKEQLRPLRDTIIERAQILHYINERKPWKLGLTNPTRVYWDEYLKRSRWFIDPISYSKFRLNWLITNLREIIRLKLQKR